jgi:hypothetical protein
MLKRLTYANVMSTLALFAALGGGAYAATKLPQNSVGAAQLRKGAVNSAKIRDHSISARDLAPGVLPARATAGSDGPAGATGAVGPAGAQGPKGDKGDAGVAGAAGSARAYGFVNMAGGLSAARSHGVVSITHTPGSGVYCIQLDPSIDPASVAMLTSLDYDYSQTTYHAAGNDWTALALPRSSNLGCPSGKVEVYTAVQDFSSGVFAGNYVTDQGFFFLVP